MYSFPSIILFVRDPDRPDLDNGCFCSVNGCSYPSLAGESGFFLRDGILPMMICPGSNLYVVKYGALGIDLNQKIVHYLAFLVTFIKAKVQSTEFTGCVFYCIKLLMFMIKFYGKA